MKVCLKAFAKLKCIKYTHTDRHRSQIRTSRAYVGAKNKHKYFDFVEYKYNKQRQGLRYVVIKFDFAPYYDRLIKDRAAKPVDMLSAIGGTMGLLTGFSIISGVEIVYFAVKIILCTFCKVCNKRKENKTLP